MIIGIRGSGLQSWIFSNPQFQRPISVCQISLLVSRLLVLLLTKSRPTAWQNFLLIVFYNSRSWVLGFLFGRSKLRPLFREACWTVCWTANTPLWQPACWCSRFIYSDSFGFICKFSKDIRSMIQDHRSSIMSSDHHNLGRSMRTTLLL